MNRIKLIRMLLIFSILNGCASVPLSEEEQLKRADIIKSFSRWNPVIHKLEKCEDCGESKNFKYVIHEETNACSGSIGVEESCVNGNCEYSFEEKSIYLCF